jgi:hypothetical protein
MKTIVNEQLVKRRANLGKWALFGGMGVLALGFVLSLSRQGSVGWMLGCLVLGWLLSTIGSANTMRWARRPRADEMIAQAIKGFDDRYRLYNYVLPAPHVLLSPAGLFVLTAMRHEGRIRYEDGKWRRDFSLWRTVRFMTEEGLGRPHSLASAEAADLQKWLDQQEDPPEAEIHSVLVFVHPTVELDARDAPQPALLPKDLKRLLSTHRTTSPLGKKEYYQFRRVFDSVTDGKAE